MERRWVAVQGKSGSCRIVTVYAASAEEARAEVERVLSTNPQRREILRVWREQGSHVKEEA